MERRSSGSGAFFALSDILRTRRIFLMSATTETRAIPPVSVLGDQERELAEGVYDFALETIGPRVAAMDRDNVMDPDIIRKFFDLDLMGIEIPEELGGLGANFTTSIAIIEALARVDAACAVVVDVQNTLVNNAIKRWASPALQKKYFPILAKQKVASYALSEAGSGSDAFALATPATPAGGRDRARR